MAEDIRAKMQRYRELEQKVYDIFIRAGRNAKKRISRMKEARGANG